MEESDLARHRLTWCDKGRPLGQGDREEYYVGMQIEPDPAIQHAVGAGTERLTYTPSEFAALFRKSPSWAYRQLYKGRLRAITGYGRIIIPHSEVERLLQSKVLYNGAGDRSAS